MMERGLSVVFFTLVLVFSISLTSAFWPFDYFKGGITGNVVDGTSFAGSDGCSGLHWSNGADVNQR